MALFKIHFQWKEKDVELMARQLDMTHPYFVAIKDLIFPKRGSLIIDPSQDDIQKAFGNTNHIMLPFQTVKLIEELTEEAEQTETKRVRPFAIIDEDDDR